MKKITLLFFAMFCFAFTWQINAQLVATQTFSTSGTDAASTVLTINSGDINVNEGQPITATSLTNFISRYNSSTGGETWCDTWYSFDLAVVGGVADGTSIIEGCAADFEGLDVTGFTTITLTSVDIDAWTDLVFFYIDLEVTYDTPPCPAPSNLTALNFTVNSADLGWSENGSSTNWDIEWGVDGFSPTGTPNVNDTGDNNPYTLGSLSEGTDYDFYVRSDCGANDTDVSVWAGPFSFTTAFSVPECATAPFPVDGAIDVPAGNIIFTWTAPASGSIPTSYNLYAYDDALGTNPALIGNFTDTFAELVISAFDVDIFWSAVAVNGDVEATGCDVWSFTTESYPGYCLFGDYGLYPADTFTPTTCDGTTPNVIATNSWPGEYSNVAVTVGQTYQFTTSTPDLITISYDGASVEASGVSAVTWTATADGTVRFYSNLDDNACGSTNVGRTKSVLCGSSLGVDEFNVASLKAYPNPVKDVLHLSNTTEISSLAVYNMLGQEVLRTAPNNVNSAVDMSALQTGAYFVKVTINDRTKTIRVIKE